MLAYVIERTASGVAPYVVIPWLFDEHRCTRSSVRMEAHSLAGARALVPAWSVFLPRNAEHGPEVVECWWPGYAGALRVSLLREVAWQ